MEEELHRKVFNADPAIVEGFVEVAKTLITTAGTTAGVVYGAKKAAEVATAAAKRDRKK